MTHCVVTSLQKMHEGVKATTFALKHPCHTSGLYLWLWWLVDLRTMGTLSIKHGNTLVACCVVHASHQATI